MQPQQSNGHEVGNGWHPIQDSKWLLSWILFFAQVLAAPIELMLRTRFGKRYFGLPHAVALVGLPMWMVFWPGEDPGTFVFFWLAALLMQVRARMEQLRLSLRGQQEHSRYNGRSSLAFVLRRMSERSIKSIAEPLLVLVIGLTIRPEEGPLGSYLIAAAISLWINDAVIRFRERTVAQDLHDAWIEQQNLAQRVRAMQGQHLR